MDTFFSFWPDIPQWKSFSLFGVYHFTAMIIVGVTLFFVFKLMKHLSKEKTDFIIKAVAIALPMIEGLKVIWLYSVGQTDFVKLLPLHLCGMQVFFIPIAVFTELRGFKELVYCTSILGGIAAIVYPVGVVDTYPIIHFQTIHTFVFHFILIFIPVALIKFKGFRPEIKNYPKLLGIFLGTAGVAAFVDFKFDQNYMFLNTPPVGTPLEEIFNVFGSETYLMVFLILGIAVSLLMFLPYRKSKLQKKIS